METGQQLNREKIKDRRSSRSSSSSELRKVSLSLSSHCAHLPPPPPLTPPTPPRPPGSEHMCESVPVNPSCCRAGLGGGERARSGRVTAPPSGGKQAEHFG